jgi:hypothetical protein
MNFTRERTQKTEDRESTAGRKVGSSKLIEGVRGQNQEHRADPKETSGTERQAQPVASCDTLG